MFRLKHVEQLRSTGIINSPTRSHLVDYFYKVTVNINKKESVYEANLKRYLDLKVLDWCSLTFKNRASYI